MVDIIRWQIYKIFRTESTMLLFFGRLWLIKIPGTGDVVAESRQPLAECELAHVDRTEGRFVVEERNEGVDVGTRVEDVYVFGRIEGILFYCAVCGDEFSPRAQCFERPECEACLAGSIDFEQCPCLRFNGNIFFKSEGSRIAFRHICQRRDEAEIDF